MSLPLPPFPPNPFCASCSKPIRSGGYILSPSGEVFHIRCRSRDLQLNSLEERARARIARERSVALVEETTRRQNAQPRPQVTPLCAVCRKPATVPDWRPLPWIAVENCGCVGYFVWTPLLDEDRLTQLAIEDRETLSRQIRELRARHE